MNENEQHSASVAEQKNKIRERYKGIDPDELDVIPAIPQEDIFAENNEQNVAVYARVWRIYKGDFFIINGLLSAA